MSDEAVAHDRVAILEFVRVLGRRLWAAVPDDANGYLHRICDVFGVTMTTAEHYTLVLKHPGLATGGHPDLGSDA